MRNFERCEICKEWHWTNDKCLPEYFVYHEEYMGDEAKSIRASSHWGAALKYGEYYNQDDYPLMDGDTIKVKVEKDNVINFFNVGAEPDIHYTANKIDSLEDNQS